MKVLVVGFHSLWDLMAQCASAFESLGIQARIFYTNRRGSMTQRLMRRTEGLLRGTPPGFTRKSQEQMNEQLLKIARKFHPNLIFVVKGDDLFPETVERLKEAGVPSLVNWATDDPFSYAGVPEGLPFYDHLFICNPAYEPRLSKNGARQVTFLPFACDPSIHRTVPLSPRLKKRYGSSICFVGTLYPFRAALLKSVLEFDLAIWGEPFQGFADADTLQDSYRGKAGQKETVKIYNASHIVLNPHHPQNSDGTNMRTFEAAACGIFQLTTRTPYLQETFETANEIVCYSDPGEVKDLAGYYLKHEEKRCAIAKRAQATVRNRHTYRHRMRQVLEKIRG